MSFNSCFNTQTDPDETGSKQEEVAVNFRMSKFAILALSVAALSCGEARTPVDPVLDTGLPTPSIDSSRPAGRFVFGSRALTKHAVGPSWSAIHVFESTLAALRADEGGELSVEFDEYGDNATVRVEDVSFVVQPNSIGGVDLVWGKRYPIMMEVHCGVRI